MMPDCLSRLASPILAAAKAEANEYRRAQARAGSRS